MAERIQAILQRVEHLKDPSNTRQVGLPPLLLVDVPWLAAQLQTAQTLLQQLEWASYDKEWAEYSCSICRASQGTKHLPTCELAAFLRGPEGTR